MELLFAMTHAIEDDANDGVPPKEDKLFKLRIKENYWFQPVWQNNERTNNERKRATFSIVCRTIRIVCSWRNALSCVVFYNFKA